MRGQPFYISPFAGGLNLRDTPNEMESHFSPDALNVVSTPDGVLHKRRGYNAFSGAFAGAGASDVASIFASNTLGAMVAVTFAGRWYSLDVNGNTTDINGAFALQSNNRWTFVEAVASGGQGPIYAMPSDPASTPRFWIGPGNNVGAWTAGSGTLPTAQYMVYFKNRVILCGSAVGTNGCGLKASAVGDPRNWDTTVVGAASAWLTNIDAQDGDSFKGLVALGQNLLAFKSNKTYLIYDLDTGANRLINGNVGCSAPETILNTPYGVFFLATNGSFYKTDGKTFEKVSGVLESDQNIEANLYTGVTRAPAFGMGSTMVATPNFFANTSTPLLSPIAVYYNDRIYVTNQFDEFNGGMTYEYDLKTGAWWQHNIPARKWVTWDTPTNQSKLYAAQRTNAGNPKINNMFVVQAEGAVQDGVTSFTSYHKSIPLAPFYFRRKLVQDYLVRRRFHALRVYTSGVVDLQVAYDDARNAALTTVANYNNFPHDGLIERTKYSLGVHNSIIVGFRQTGFYQFSVTPFTLFTHPRTD